MKKIVLIIYLLTTVVLLNAQVYLGVNAKIVLPAGSFKEIDYGVGTDFLIGYLLQDKLNIDLCISNLWASSILYNYQMGYLKANIKYNILQNSVKPYLGIGLGYFRKTYSPFSDKFYEYGIGVTPLVGILFDLESVKGLALNTQLSYNKIFTEHQTSMLNCKIGLLYNFGKE